MHQPVPGLGWHDEMTDRHRWHDLAIENKARVSAPSHGVLKLALNTVPAGWPYAYQWSGITRDIRLDVGRFPNLAAYVCEVNGYAHLDIDVLDEKGKAVKTLRSTTLTAPGISTLDLRGSLDPAVYKLRIRLIVGGSNSGCTASYDWLRFARTADDIAKPTIFPVPIGGSQRRLDW